MRSVPIGLSSRISRRKVIGVAATTGLAAGAASLVGCGGGSDSGSSEDKAASNSPLYKPVDTTGQAKPGGIFESYIVQDVSGWDYLGATANLDRGQASYVYSRLFKWKVGVGQEPRGEIDGDLAESYELAPDNQQLTVKLKAAKWDARAPTSSRVLDSEDVKVSFGRMHDKSVYRNDWFNDLNANGPIKEILTPDAKTVVLKFAFPIAAIFEYLGNSLGFFVMPKETDTGFDPRKDARGTGPWFVDKYEPSVSINYKRNPNWYGGPKPFLDGWTNTIIKEYAQQLAQFKTGNLWGSPVTQQDILITKKDVPQLNLYQNDYSDIAPGVFFGWQTPQFKDIRVRQAMSQLIDRETFAKSFANQDQFTAEGIDIALQYDNFAGRGWGEYWVDPFGKEAGPDAANFKFDITNAKKLLSAAGFPNGFSIDMFAPSGLAYGQTYVNYQQALGGFFGDGGIKVNFKEVGYSNDYVPNYNYNQYFDGISTFANTTYGGIANNLRTNWHSGSAQDRSPFAPSKIGKPAAAGKDSVLDGMIEKLLREPDHAKGVEQVKEIQRYLTKVLYTIPFSYKTRSLSLAWPFVANAGVYRPWVSSVTPTDTLPFLWYDATKKKA